MQVNIEKNTNRKYYRIELPAKIIIDDNSYDVKDWSLGGFMVLNVNNDLSENWEGDVKMLLPFDNVDISVKAKARVAWITDGNAGFTFVDMTSKVKHILKTYMKASVEGNLGDVDGVIAYVDAPEIPLPTEKPMTKDEEKKFKRNFFTRSTIYWLLGIFIVFASIITMYYSMTKASSLHAVVSLPKVVINAPYAGGIKKIYVKSGDRVKQGQVLASLDNEELLKSVDTQRKAIVVAQKELAEDEAWLKLVKKGIKMYSENTIYAEVDVFNARVATKIEKVKEETARLEEYLARLDNSRILAPCDSEIYVSKLLEGSDVKHGDEMFILRPLADKQATVLARFTFQEAKGIKIGDRADVFIPSLGKKVSGTVNYIGHQALSGINSTTPDFEISLSEVPISILLDDNELELYTGMGAEVNITTDIKARMRLLL